MDDLTRVPSDEKREEIRARTLLARPSWYHGWLHLASPSLVGLGAVVTAAVMVRDTTWRQMLAVPGTLLFLNAVEWRIHKSMLHQRTPISPMLYDRHTREHHQIFLTEDMAMRSRDEFWLVLIPPYANLLVAVAVAPFVAGIWFLGQPNIAWMFMATCVSYVMLYEWFHLSYHLPVDHPIGRMKIVRKLAHHHAVHHDPRLMQKWNFNVTVPLWDFVRGTTFRGDRSALDV